MTRTATSRRLTSRRPAAAAPRAAPSEGEAGADDAEPRRHVVASIDPDHETAQENLAILEEHRAGRG